MAALRTSQQRRNGAPCGRARRLRALVAESGVPREANRLPLAKGLMPIMPTSCFRRASNMLPTGFSLLPAL